MNATVTNTVWGLWPPGFSLIEEGTARGTASPYPHHETLLCRLTASLGHLGRIQGSTHAITMPARSPPADWASLPAELLRRIAHLLSVDVHARRPIDLEAAAGLRLALSPCRRWRAVALDRVSEWSAPPLLAFKRNKLQLPVHPASSLDGQWLP